MSMTVEFNDRKGLEMSEKIGIVRSRRETADILMGIFGAPDSAQDTATTVTGTAAYVTLRAEKWYRFLSTEHSHVRFVASGSSDVATTSFMMLVANVPEMLYVAADKPKVSVIRNADDGVLHTTEFSTDYTRET